MTAAPVQQKTKKPRQSSDLKPVINESGIEVKTLYTLEDVIRSGGIDQSPPGEPPFTRGIHSEMYRRRPWTMRQYTGFANAADTNKRFKYLIENGQTGLNVAFDSGDAVWLRFRRAGSDGRGRPRRHGRRYAAGFRDCLRRHRPRRHHGVADDQRGGRDPDCHVPGDGGEARLRPGQAARDRPE